MKKVTATSVSKNFFRILEYALAALIIAFNVIQKLIAHTVIQDIT